MIELKISCEQYESDIIAENCADDVDKPVLFAHPRLSIAVLLAHAPVTIIKDDREYTISAGF
jgi:hypothetical protein